jgi:uncharacterized Ntn-hydrolase superfamily protein
MLMRLSLAAGALLVAPLVAASAQHPSAQHPAARGPGDTLTMNTWSVVAVDPKTGDVGVAMASCVPNTLADALAALVPGKGAAATQAAFDVKNRNVVYEALKAGMPAAEIIQRVTSPAVDTAIGRRQYGVVTMSNGSAQTAGFTGKPMLDGNDNPASHRWAGVRADASRGVSVQGNTLVSSQTVEHALAAFLWDDPAGFNMLSDRLIRAVEAGSIAGGDMRCISGTLRQTAATSMILVARGGDAPYATEKIGMSDQGTPKAPWLEISVTTEKGGDNPLLELRRRYDRWRRGVTLR